jgi:hypothetical protein
VRGRAGVNHVRFKGRIGRRALGPGTYALAVRGAQRLRRVVVIVGPQSRVRFDCSDAGDFALAASLPQFPPPAAAEPARSAKQGFRGVLPAVTNKIRGLPNAVAVPPVPMPSLPPEGAGAPPTALGLLALALFALSAVAIVAYVIRFLGGPQTESARSRE